MDAKLQELKRLAKQGDAEDKARYLAVLVKSGQLSRGKVQLAAMFKSPEAILLEPQEQGNFLGKDADLYHKVYFLAREANYYEIDLQELCRQLALNYIKTSLLPDLRERLTENKRYTLGELRSFWDVATNLDYSWHWDLIYRWQWPIGVSHDDLDRFAIVLSRNVSYRYINNFILYGNIAGLNGL